MRRPALALVLAAVVVAGLVLVVALVRQGPDRTVTGPISRLEPRRVCVTGDGGPVCADADAPSRLAGFATGDCVRLRASADGILVSLDRSAAGC